MKDVIDRSHLSLRPWRLLKKAILFVLIVSGSIFLLGWVAGVQGDEAWGAPLCFMFIAGLAFVHMTVMMYVRGFRNTPRTIEVQGGTLLISSPIDACDIPISSCTWTSSLATKDTVLGWFLDRRECVVVTLESGTKVALGYTQGTCEEWLGILLQATN
jgi:hypothetical protein